MKIPTDAKCREELLKKYREAVAYQLGVWNTTLSMGVIAMAARVCIIVVVNTLIPLRR